MWFFILFILATPIICFGGMAFALATGVSVFASMVIMFVGVSIAMAACS